MLFIEGRSCAALLVLAALAAASVAVAVAVRNYRASHSLLEADPPSALLDAPERTGIPGLKSVSFVSADRLQISAWYAAPTNGAAVVVTHGTQ